MTQNASEEAPAGLTVAAVQLSPGEDRQQNLALAVEQTLAAVDAGARFVVLPEYFPWYGAPSTWRAFAEDHAPAVLETFADIAAQRSVHLLLGTVLTPAADGRVRNAAVLLGPGGEVARYAKIHLFDVDTPGMVFRESETLEPGSDVVVADVEGFRVGLAICYDLRFPALFAAMRRRGAELVCLPSAFTLHTGKDHWEPLLRARAIENEYYMLAAALTGDCSGKTCNGRSMLVDPWGLVTARASDGIGFTLGRVERHRIEAVRTAIPIARHERLDLG